MITLLILFIVFMLVAFVLPRLLTMWIRRRVPQPRQSEEPPQNSESDKKISKDTGEYVDFEEVKE